MAIAGCGTSPTRRDEDLASRSLRQPRVDLSKTRGLVAWRKVKKQIQRSRDVFRHGYEAGLIDRLRYGRAFQRTPALWLRQSSELLGLSRLREGRTTGQPVPIGGMWVERIQPRTAAILAGAV